MAYNTGNPVGSTNPKDLIDNSAIIDKWANDPYAESVSDRLGVDRKTLHGMELAFDAMLESVGYIFAGEYAAGIELTMRNQLLREDGEFWRLSAQVELPYTTTGVGMPEDDAFVSVGDAVLRGDLAAPTGAQEVGFGGESVHAALQKQESALLSNGNFERVGSLARAGKLRLAILGDSTAAGVGGGGGTYGECNADAFSGYAMPWAWALINSDPTFVGASPASPYYRRSSYIDVSSVPSAFPHYNLVYSQAPVVPAQEVVQPNGSVTTNKLSVYFNERTSGGALAVTIEVTHAVSGAVLATQVIDTYTPAVSFGSVGSVSVSGRINRAVLTLSSAVSKCKVRISSLNLVDRGSGLPTDGSANIYGFALGEGVLARNFAVSSTTLTNTSGANITRGVTTDGRFQKAYDMGANAVVLNWGTNDSKAGVTSPAAFTDALNSRIAEMRSYLPGISILLATTTAGGSGSVYENNVNYFSLIRDVAYRAGCGLFDGEGIIGQLPRADVVADEVHPNAVGYEMLSGALAEMTGCRMPVALPPVTSAVPQVTGYAGANGGVVGSDFTGNWVLVMDQPVGSSASAVQLVAEASMQLFRAGAEIGDCEIAISFEGVAGGGRRATPSGTTSVLVGASGDARGQVLVKTVLTSGTNFTGGPYWIKVWARNYAPRNVDDALRLFWKFEPLA